MKCLIKKVICNGVELDKNDTAQHILDFDSPFQGKVKFECHKVGKTLVIEIEVDGYEYH